MDPKFSILTFPQAFDGDKLHLNILVVPRLSTAWNGDPLKPIPNPPGPDVVPAFADANLQFEVRALDGFARFPVNTPVDFAGPLDGAGGATPDARALFQSLVAPGPGRFKLSANPPRLADPVNDKIFIKKYLPRTYRNAFLFAGSRTLDAVTDDSYSCAFKARRDPNPAFKQTPDEVGWGEIYAFCLRHPALAKRVGLIRQGSFKVAGGLFAHGGFVYVGLAAGSSYAAEAAAQFDFLKLYAARVPSLTAGQKRQVFAAVVFPVLNSIPGPPVAPGNYDDALIEAAAYDSGYAQIVHAVQPVSQNLLAEDPDGIAPLTDIGIRLGWDDEQILIWQNRQLKADPTVPLVGGQPQRLDAPMGVFGYRIDARRHPDVKWTSLVHVRAKADLKIDAVNLGRVVEELPIEVHPQQLDGYQDTSQFWLPQYLAQWNGKSLVLPDEDAASLFHTEKAVGKPASLGRKYDALDLDNVPLRYGSTYDFRVRLMDPTGGGPKGDLPPAPGAAPAITTVPFRRHVVPEPVAIDGLPLNNDLFTKNKLTVHRPLLGYPAVVFTGKYANPVPLLQAASDAAVGKSSFGIADPDVTAVRIDVEVATLRMDNQMSISGKEPYILYYSTTRAFPAAFEQARDIPLDYRDIAVLKFGDPGDLGGGLTQVAIDAGDALPLPTAREIRLTVRAIAPDDPVYFATGANTGKPVQLKVRSESKDERKLAASTKIRGIYLQPDPALVWNGSINTLILQRARGSSPLMIDNLAREIGVDHKDMTLVGRAGERILFGCSSRIRHTLSPDHSSLTFAAKEDLNNHWIVAITMDLARDWTWNDVQPVSFEIHRTKQFKRDVEIDDNGGRPVGDWEAIRTASLLALQNPNREHTTLIFLDAVEPKSELKQAGDPFETRFPDVIELDYTITPFFTSAPAQKDDPGAFKMHLELPVTTPPFDAPRIASAGVALSKYKHSDDYSTTEARRKHLWIEMAEPLKNPADDDYFIRYLAYAPDPLLSDDRIETFLAPEEPPLAIDPEYIRTIAPGATDDDAGLSAMGQRLEPAGNSDVHFLAPLPPGMNPDSPELFGFFTCEIRAGHSRVWCTAQGRPGRALRVTGAQFPPPTLFCTVNRNESEMTVEAPYALAVFNGKNITHSPPRTELWALLYAQVRQADGKDYRNILLEDRMLNLVPRVSFKLAAENRDSTARGATAWKEDEIVLLLENLGLPRDSPISVLVVEMMPTLNSLRVVNQPNVAGFGENLASRLLAGIAGVPAVEIADARENPLSDGLGNYRILRTSPLTAAPAVCCADCV